MVQKKPSTNNMQVGKNPPSYYIIKYSRALLGLQNIDISRKEKYVQSDGIKMSKLKFHCDDKYNFLQK